MFKVALFAASLLLAAGIAGAGIINPCNSPVEMLDDVLAQTLASKCYFACPQGDTPGIKASGFWFRFLMRDIAGNPIQSIAATDFWLIDCDPARDLTLCAGSGSSNADSATNSQGRTTMTVTPLRVGGCANGLSPVVQGYQLLQPPGCTPYCFDVKVRSGDLTGNLAVDISDLSQFATYFPPNAYNECGDFDCNGQVNISDLARFAFHFGPPGHKCV
jgi:hypothetical protein